MKMFHTRERLLEHLKYKGKICRKYTFLLGYCMTEEEADTIDVSLRPANVELARMGKRRHHVDKWCKRLQGPIIPIILDPQYMSNHHPFGRGYNHY